MSVVTHNTHPVALATSLALETFSTGEYPTMFTDRIVPKPFISIEKYDAIYINIYTILRNIVESIPDLDFKKDTKEVLAEYLYHDLEYLESFFKNTNRTYHLILDTYDDLGHYKPFVLNIKTVKPGTKAAAKSDLINNTLKYCLKNNRLNYLSNTATLKAKHKKRRVLMMTHVPIDLFYKRGGDEIHLLESHTGIVKTKDTLYTKYARVGKDKVPALPWNAMLYYIFGDSGVMRPMDIKVRREVLALAETEKWTPNTPSSSIRKALHRSQFASISEAAHKIRPM